MTNGWTSGEAPQVATHAPGAITLLDGSTFSISDRNGDIRLGGEHGLYFRDSRFLARLELTINRRSVDPLAVYRSLPFSAVFVGRLPPDAGRADSTLLVVRRRSVGNGLLEEVSIRNLAQETTIVDVSIAVDTDFAGLFEVKSGRVDARATVKERTEEGDGRASLWLSVASVESLGEQYQVTVLGTNNPMVRHRRLTWQAVIAPRGVWSGTVEVRPVINGIAAPRRHRAGQPIATSEPANERVRWQRAIPTVTTPNQSLRTLLTATAEDLGSLRILDPDAPDQAVIAAGAPWFMTLFGRDSLLTSWMVLPIDPTLALGTLEALARLQGKEVNPVTEEEPGRILHEIREAPDVEAALGGRNAYYGSIDATPLFVMLLGELQRWGFASDRIKALIPYADRALHWIEEFGDRDGDGFVEYKRRTDRGLANQGWKDSFDAIAFASGAPAEPPIALAEVQGYVYAAYGARARLARESGDNQGYRNWASRAAALKRRFNQQFWLPDQECFALALDAHKEPVDALASNMGHCLWTGIVDEDKAGAVARHLAGPEMFTGFGIRTLASSMSAFNPMSYHNGSVWPHDTAIAVAGLMRYGFSSEAEKIAAGLMEAASHFGGRLPELFCGFDIADFAHPVPYPTSCSPQAWAAASPLLLLRSLFRFDPSVPLGKIWCDPVIPAQWLPLCIDGIHVGEHALTLTVQRHDWNLSGLPAHLQLVRGPRPPTGAVGATPSVTPPGSPFR